MEDWGDGMLQSGAEYDIIRAYDEKLGLRELRAKINHKAEFTLTNMQPYALSIAAEFCYGTVGVEISRKYLDTGPLSEELAAFADLDPVKGSATATLKLITLSASVMTLGCIMPASIIKSLKKIVQIQEPPVFRTETARSQMTKAVLNYTNGTPHDFGNKTKNEDFVSKLFPGTTTTINTVGCTKLIKMTCPNGKVVPHIIGPPDDNELGVTPVHPYDVCASCGNDRLKANGGEKLLVCGQCKTRRYCSKACQRKNWTFHKPICSRPKDEMERFLEDIPLDFAGDAHPDYDEMMSAPHNLVSGKAIEADMYG